MPSPSSIYYMETRRTAVCLGQRNRTCRIRM
uniref:Uncharacterized protein n=1 Tax=Arundo donax TaxID=35708 RepID=A0A0A8XNZ9_ARUDO